jgi:hypothetical protein
VVAVPRLPKPGFPGAGAIAGPGTIAGTAVAVLVLVGGAGAGRWWWLGRSAASVRAREVGAREAVGGLRLFGRRPGGSGATR